MTDEESASVRVRDRVSSALFRPLASLFLRHSFVHMLKRVGLEGASQNCENGIRGGTVPSSCRPEWMDGSDRHGLIQSRLNIFESFQSRTGMLLLHDSSKISVIQMP